MECVFEIDEIKLTLFLTTVNGSGHFIKQTCLFKYTEKFTIKNENFQIKNSDIFQISAQNIDCGYSLEPPRRGGSNEYPQSMFLSRNKKNIVYPCKTQFYNIKVGFKGIKIIYVCVINSSIVITLLGRRELVALLFFNMLLVYCLSWFVCFTSWSH